MTEQTQSPKPFKVSRKALRQNPPAPAALKVKTPRLLSLRKILWLFEIIIVLAVIEHFLIRPNLPKDEPAPYQPPKGECLPLLGENANLPQGLSECAPAYLPVTDDLPQEVIPAIQRQLDASGHNGLPVETVNSIGIHFRLIPQGTCSIGSPLDEPGHTAVETQHDASFLTPFYMASCQITQEQWMKVMGPQNNPSHFQGQNLPVEEVSWTQCLEFCRKLCELEQLPKLTYRLPTEAEWEYACRAGSTKAYCFGNDQTKLDLYADFDGNNYKRTSPVAQRLPNAFGLYDMHGNVWEWCMDLYKNYPGDDTPKSSAHTYRCVRGGNWYVNAIQCRSANRCRLPDQTVGNMLGFRIIRTLDKR